MFSSETRVIPTISTQLRLQYAKASVVIYVKIRLQVQEQLEVHKLLQTANIFKQFS